MPPRKNSNGVNPSDKAKAKLRGVLHNYAAVAAAAAGAMLVLAAHTPAARWSCALYALTLTTMFIVSASYHRPAWSPEARAFMRKADHSCIYLLIAGTYTPLSVLALDQGVAMRVVSMVWIGAAAGVIHTIFAKGVLRSKMISAAFYVALGWIVLPYAGQLRDSLTPASTALVVAGGVVYTLGAAVYATHWPDPSPAVFGFHEVFHLATLIAALLHFAAIYIVVLREAPQC